MKDISAYAEEINEYNKTLSDHLFIKFGENAVTYSTWLSSIWENGLQFELTDSIEDNSADNSFSLFCFKPSCFQLIISHYLYQLFAFVFDTKKAIAIRFAIMEDVEPVTMNQFRDVHISNFEEVFLNISNNIISKENTYLTIIP